MQTILPKIVETLLANENLADDFDEVATRCIITIQSNIADLNMWLLSWRGKKPTDKRREIACNFIANILFYTAILVHLNDVPVEILDMDAEDETGPLGIRELADNFDEVYYNSPLILGNYMMGCITDIGAAMWDDSFNNVEDVIDDEPLPEGLETPKLSKTTATPLEIPQDPKARSFIDNIKAEMESAGANVTVLDGSEVDFEEDPDDTSDAEEIIAHLLAACLIMAQNCDIDIKVAMYNASIQTEI